MEPHFVRGPENFPKMVPRFLKAFRPSRKWGLIFDFFLWGSNFMVSSQAGNNYIFEGTISQYRWNGAGAARLAVNGRPWKCPLLQIVHPFSTASVPLSFGLLPPSNRRNSNQYVQIIGTYGYCYTADPDIAGVESGVFFSSTQYFFSGPNLYKALNQRVHTK